MATPAIGDNIIDQSKVMTSATAARARSLTTPTALSARMPTRPAATVTELRGFPWQ